MISKNSWLLPFSLTTTLLAATSMGLAYDGKVEPKVATEQVQELKNVGITENLGTKLDLSTIVTNEKGQQVPLSTYFDGKKPVILSLVYFQCSGLCSLHLNGLVDGLKQLEWTIGDHFNLVVLSFDPSNTAATAHDKRVSYIQSYGRDVKDGDWPFLTASAENIKKITDTVGFKFEWNDELKEWMHASAAIIVSPDGKISRYLHGVMFEAPTLKMSLNEATEGKTGTFVDKMIWYCFKYDPHQSKYTLYAFRLVQLGAALMVLLLGAFLVSFWLKSRKGPTAAR